MSLLIVCYWTKSPSFVRFYKFHAVKIVLIRSIDHAIEQKSIEYIPVFLHNWLSVSFHMVIYALPSDWRKADILILYVLVSICRFHDRFWND